MLFEPSPEQFILCVGILSALLVIGFTLVLK